MLILVIIILISAIAASDVAVDIDALQTLIFATNYTVSANRIWPGVAQTMAEANNQFAALSSIVTRLYATNTSSFYFVNCSIPTYQTLMSNETAEQAVLCCFARHLRRGTPLLKFLDYAATNIYGVANVAVDGNDFVSEIRDQQIYERDIFQIKMCAQNTTIMVPEAFNIRSTGFGDALYDLLVTLNSLVSRATQILNCINAPLEYTDCILNTTLTSNPPSPIVKNLIYDTAFDSVCSTASLASFESKRLNPSC